MLKASLDDDSDDSLFQLSFSFSLDLDFTVEDSEELAKCLSASATALSLFFLGEDLESFLELLVGGGELRM
jgi:hypothetical protein